MPAIPVRIWCFVALATSSALIATFAQSLAGAQNLSLLFSTPITGGRPVRIAIDAQGYIYLAGKSSNPDAAPIFAEAAPIFVMKLTPSRSVVYTTYFQGTRFSGEPGDCPQDIAAIAVDKSGAAYVTGCTSALDFPLANPFRSTPQGTRGSGFLAKVSPLGSVVYSTYLESRGTAIAVDDQGNAYVAGAASGNLPVVSPASAKGVGFAVKFDSSGSRLLYATYLSAMPRAIAVDRFGAAYVAGAGTLGESAVRPIQPCNDEGSDDAIVIKLNPAGSSYDYATCLGGFRDDVATGIAVDASGGAYVVGTTISLDFPTVRPLDVPFRTGPLWKTEDAGRTWTNLPLDGYSVSELVASKTSPTWYAVTLYGGFKSVDQGTTWRRLGLPLRSRVFRLMADPRMPGMLYASTGAGFFKSTDDGEHWTAIGAVLPSGGAYLRAIAVDPADSRVVYAASQRGFWKSIDGGASWTVTNRDLDVNSLSVDPVTGVLYTNVRPVTGPVTVYSVFRSTDAGVTWTPTALEIRQRSVSALTAVRARSRAALLRTRAPGRDSSSDETSTSGETSTVYLAAHQVISGGPFGLLFRSDDGADTWESIGGGLPDWGTDVLAVAPSRPRILYVASRGVVFVSRDRGNTFEPLPGISFGSVGSIESLAVDPLKPTTVLVGARSRSDVFVAKIGPGGGSLAYSTYLGGSGDDRAAGVVVDDLGRAIVFGSTESDDLPAVAALQARRGVTDGFVSILDGGGSVLLFSTWLGGSGCRRDRLDNPERATASRLGRVDRSGQHVS
jgi:photosystem II stability/assembly factor-like uncharacterized protein